MFLTEFSGYDNQTDNWLNGMAAFFASSLGIRSEKQILYATPNLPSPSNQPAEKTLESV